MIPTEIYDLAHLIWPEYSSSDDEEAKDEVLKAAWRVWHSGFRPSRA